MAGGGLTSEITYTAGRTLFAFLKRNLDGLYYKTADTDFEIFDILNAPEGTRSGFRINFVENPAGQYAWTVDVSNFTDGVYTLITRELNGQIESQAGADYTVTIAEGSIVEGAVLGDHGMDHDTGGALNLQYTTQAGEPVSGASVRVFLKADYDAGTYVPKGVTSTDSTGKWQSPVFVPTGQTYTIVFSKPGFFGPDAVEVTV